MSDTVTLIAGVLLISVGLLSLLPYVLKRVWRRSGESPPVDSSAASAPAVATVLQDHTLEQSHADVVAEQDAEQDMEALLTHLFSLRLTVSDMAAEVHEAHETLGRAARSGETAGFLEEPA